MSKRKITPLVVILVLGFVLGYYNGPISQYFLNYQALCGFLFAIILLLLYYILILQKKEQRSIAKQQQLDSILETDRFSNKIVNEKLTQFEGRLNARFNELHNSIQLHSNLKAKK